MLFRIGINEIPEGEFIAHLSIVAPNVHSAESEFRGEFYDRDSRVPFARFVSVPPSNYVPFVYFLSVLVLESGELKDNEFFIACGLVASSIHSSNSPRTVQHQV